MACPVFCSFIFKKNFPKDKTCKYFKIYSLISLWPLNSLHYFVTFLQTQPPRETYITSTAPNLILVVYFQNETLYSCKCEHLGLAPYPHLNQFLVKTARRKIG